MLSVALHAWLLIEIGAGRSTCEELVYETTAALGTNIALLLLGCLHGMYSSREEKLCGDGYGTLLLAAVSAIVVILSSRLTLFVHEAHLICAADAPHVASTDLLRDADTRGMLGGLAWGALLLLGVALLLQHCKPWWSDDCDDDCGRYSREDPCDCPPAKKKVFGIVYANVDRAPRRFAHPGIRA